MRAGDWRRFRFGFGGVAVLAAGLLQACVQPGGLPLTNVEAPPAPKPVAGFRDCVDCPEMTKVPAGNFMMGSPKDEAGRQADEGPQHPVTIAKPFAVGVFEITYGEYQRFVEATGRAGYDWKLRDNSIGDYSRYPVTTVSWQDAKDYAAWLSQRTGKHYRLLTEAEWEYVARAGTHAPKEPEDTMRGPNPPVADGFRATVPVGSYQPNAFGVYDLTGNIPEWTEDCYRESYAGAPNDGTAVEGACKQRVVRGTYNDAFFAKNDFLRIANRDWGFSANGAVGNPTGIRVARDLP